MISSVFTNNRSQAVRLPAELRLPDSVKRVQVRAVGPERVIAPIDRVWDSLFEDGPAVSDDFLAGRASLERAGTPIGINDLHIAAHARSEGLVLVTNNVGEFARVPGLMVENGVAA